MTSKKRKRDDFESDAESSITSSPAMGYRHKWRRNQQLSKTLKASFELREIQVDQEKWEFVIKNYLINMFSDALKHCDPHGSYSLLSPLPIPYRLKCIKQAIEKYYDDQEVARATTRLITEPPDRKKSVFDSDWIQQQRSYIAPKQRQRLNQSRSRDDCLSLDSEEDIRIKKPKLRHELDLYPHLYRSKQQRQYNKLDLLNIHAPFEPSQQHPIQVRTFCQVLGMKDIHLQDILLSNQNNFIQNQLVELKEYREESLVQTIAICILLNCDSELNRAKICNVNNIGWGCQFEERGKQFFKTKDDCLIKEFLDSIECRIVTLSSSHRKAASIARTLFSPASLPDFLRPPATEAETDFFSSLPHTSSSRPCIIPTTPNRVYLLDNAQSDEDAFTSVQENFIQFGVQPIFTPPDRTKTPYDKWIDENLPFPLSRQHLVWFRTPVSERKRAKLEMMTLASNNKGHQYEQGAPTHNQEDNYDLDDTHVDMKGLEEKKMHQTHVEGEEEEKAPNKRKREKKEEPIITNKIGKILETQIIKFVLKEPTLSRQERQQLGVPNECSVTEWDHLTRKNSPFSEKTHLCTHLMNKIMNCRGLFEIMMELRIRIWLLEQNMPMDIIDIFCDHLGYLSQFLSTFEEKRQAKQSKRQKEEEDQEEKEMNVNEWPELRDEEADDDYVVYKGGKYSREEAYNILHEMEDEADEIRKFIGWEGSDADSDHVVDDDDG